MFAYIKTGALCALLLIAACGRTSSQDDENPVPTACGNPNPEVSPYGETSPAEDPRSAEASPAELFGEVIANYSAERRFSAAITWRMVPRLATTN